MKSVSARLRLAVFVYLCFLGISEVPAHGQVLTGAAVIAAAKEITTDLQNLSAYVGGDVLIATNNASTQVSTATDHLAGVLHDQVNVPITQLNGTLQNEAMALNSLVTQVNLLIQHQRECLFSQADIFVAGLNTALATFKTGIPFLSGGNPTITQFIFDGHHTPNIVPADGGPLVVKGFHLWVKVPPVVVLTQTPTKDAATIQKLDPTRGPDDDSFRIALSKDLITQNAGKCLYLETTPRAKKGLFGLETVDLNVLTLPICIPQITSMKVRLSAQVVYDVPTADDGPDHTGRPLDPYQNFRFDNAECNHQHTVSVTKGWTLPDGYQIRSIDSRRSEQRNDNNNIQFSFNGNTITAAGTQDSPTCVSVHIPPFGPNIEKLVHTAIWSYDARPKIAGIAYPQKTDTETTANLDVVVPATQLCVALSKIATTAGRKTSITYTVTPVIDGKDAKAFSSPVYTTDDGTNVFPIPPSIAFNGEFSIAGQFNPNAVGGKCQACITLTDVGQCAF